MMLSPTSSLRANLCLLWTLVWLQEASSFTLQPRSRGWISTTEQSSSFIGQQHHQHSCSVASSSSRHRCGGTSLNLLNADDEEDNVEEEEEEEEEDEDDEDEDDYLVLEDPYESRAKSEFHEDAQSGGLVRSDDASVEWGGALGSLRDRLDDVASGKSQDPSQALFRLMSSQSPNQAIGSFVSSANPQVVQAMSGAVSSLLGGLSNPQMGVEMIVKASGDKIANLCLQLQMTGYMFRNAEYSMAILDLMNLQAGSATLKDYKDAFDKVDTDGSGFIETEEIQELLDSVYDGKTPAFEVETFITFFDSNGDGKVSWDEFESGLGSAMSKTDAKNKFNLLMGVDDDSDEDDDERAPDLQSQVTGNIEVELADGKTVEVEAKEYISALKAEARALKDALRREKQGAFPDTNDDVPGQPGLPQNDVFGGIAGYIASRQGNLKALTAGISPEVVDTMRLLVNFVLEEGETDEEKDIPREAKEMEIPASALQQLALWQLILGYRLREAEAKGDYLKLLD